jgi:hypothetical protein
VGREIVYIMGELKRKDWVWSGVLIRVFIATLLFCVLWVSSCGGADREGRLPQSRLEGTISPGHKAIVELQPFHQVSAIKVKTERDEEGLATLIDLNPNVNVWYLLRLNWGNGGREEAYHLENANPRTQRLLLDNNHPYGLIIGEENDRYTCDLWGPNSHDRLKKAKDSGAAYAPLCGGKLYLRNPVKGHRTKIEMVTDFLRDEVPGGEKIVGFVRDTVFKYLYRQKAEERVESKPEKSLSPRVRDNTPALALIDPTRSGRVVKPPHLGIEIEESSKNGVILGTWYAAKDNPGIYVSLIVPNAIAPEILRSYRNVVNNLDSVEARELVYLVAFDLDQFDLKYALGTDHPRVGWSDHIPDQIKDKSLPGPDGIGNIAPLISTGLISPRDEGSAIATFTGGFKRIHGAFKYGELALRNHGSHYGFIENGVIFSKLQPGLATLYVLNDGWADLKTWREEDNHLFPRVKYARQNGVPIIAQLDPVTQLSIPGPLIARWGEGNWSGSADQRLRTMRAGAALQESHGKRFLIYAFFWSATPSAMARVFQAYQCRYAMLLDMNALEHTYLALYRRQGSTLFVQHLIQGMSEVDMTVKGQYIPRFLGFSDDRDFFYLTQKEAP